MWSLPVWCGAFGALAYADSPRTGITAGMSLAFHPPPGSILICDYSTGFQPPEMVKKRPVVIVSPRRRTSQLATVVPISSVQPVPQEPWHHQLPPGAYPPARGPVWVKADVIATVALARLDRVRVTLPDGSRGYRVFQLDGKQLAAVQGAIRAALGLA